MNKHHLKSIHIAEKVFASLKEFIKPGISEKAAVSEIRKRLKSYGAKKESFRIIAASGRRSFKIHGFSSRKIIRENDIVMFDFGALYKGWRSDITRTYVLGMPTRRQKKVYNLLKRAQKNGIRKIKAGEKCSEIDRAVRDTIEKAGCGKYFIHSTGHAIGQKTHENPRLSKKSRGILKAGMVVTVEPGIYIKKWGGMRLEDMVLVTRRGSRLLTQVKRSLNL